jgi:hypothetical protein
MFKAGTALQRIAVVYARVSSKSRRRKASPFLPNWSCFEGTPPITDCPCSKSPWTWRPQSAAGVLASPP